MSKAEAEGHALWPVHYVPPISPLVAPTWCWQWGFLECDCPPECIHAEECWTTPIYAELVEELGSPWGWLHDLTICTFIPMLKGDNRK